MWETKEPRSTVEIAYFHLPISHSMWRHIPFLWSGLYDLIYYCLLLIFFWLSMNSWFRISVCMMNLCCTPLIGKLTHGSHYPSLDSTVDQSIRKFKKGLSQFTHIRILKRQTSLQNTSQWCYCPEEIHMCLLLHSHIFPQPHLCVHIPHPTRDSCKHLLFFSHSCLCSHHSPHSCHLPVGNRLN